jgi:hypothetical protein
MKQWDDSEDRLALLGLGFAALVAIWTSAKLIPVICDSFFFNIKESKSDLGERS